RRVRHGADPLGAGRNGGGVGLGPRDDPLLSGGLRVRKYGRVSGGGGRLALRGLGSDVRLPWAGAALAAARARHAALSPVTRRHSVRRGLLGQAIRLLGGGRARALLARARGRPADRGRPLLLSRRRPPP